MSLRPGALAALLAACLVASARAQGVPDGPQPQAQSLGLIQALATALRHNHEIQVSETFVTAAQGALQTATGEFGPQVQASTQETDNRTDLLRQSQASLGISQRLRNGIVLGTTVSGVGQQGLSATGGRASRSTAGLSITFPLGRGQGTEAASAQENIQRLGLRASELQLRATVSQQIFSVAQTYWRTRQAEEALAVLRAGEARAQQMVSDVRRLIQGDEQPAAAITLTEANYLSQRAARIEGERSLAATRLALTQLLGLAQQAPGLRLQPADPFPAGPGESIDAGQASQLIERSLRQRPDLQAAEASLAASRLSTRLAADNLKPLLNATLGAGVAGTGAGANPFQPLRDGRMDRQISIGLTYVWDVANDQAKGRLLSASAGEDQQAAIVGRLRGSIGAGVLAAIADYNGALAQLGQSRVLVDLYGKTVDNERTKLRFGQATLLDVMTLEDRRQQALLSHLNAMASHAVAIAALRFQLGELLQDSETTQLLPMERLLAWSPP